MATYGRWIIRAGNNCEVIEYRLEGKVNGVLVRAAGSDKWVAKIGGVPVGTPSSKGNAEKELRTEIRSRKARNMTQAELSKRVEELKARKAEEAQKAAYLKALAKREAEAKKAANPKSAVAKAVAAGERRNNTSNWRKCQHVSGQGHVRHVTDGQYAAFVRGQLVDVRNGKTNTAARNAAKRLVNETLKKQGVSWEPRVFS